jgi:hypothetical protein
LALLSGWHVIGYNARFFIAAVFVFASFFCSAVNLCCAKERLKKQTAVKQNYGTSGAVSFGTGNVYTIKFQA